MAFDSVKEFLAMGNHGVFVWSAYALSIVLLAGICGQTLLARRQTIQQLKQRFKREKKR